MNLLLNAAIAVAIYAWMYHTEAGRRFIDGPAIVVMAAFLSGLELGRHAYVMAALTAVSTVVLYASNQCNRTVARHP